MTGVKAQSVTSALIAAGFVYTIRKVGPDDWIVRVRSSVFDVGVDTANTFATNQGVLGKVQEVEFS